MLPRPLSGNKGDLLLREGEGHRAGKRGERKIGRGGEKERDERGKWRAPPCASLNIP